MSPAMRQPTTTMRLLAWHRAWMRGESPPRTMNDPQCGWYRMRSRKGGPWVPVLIWCEQVTDEFGHLSQPEVIRATSLGRSLDPCQVWEWLHPISREEFERISDFREENAHRLRDRDLIPLAMRPTTPRGLT